jgi:hypothetical protein
VTYPSKQDAREVLGLTYFQVTELAEYGCLVTSEHPITIDGVAYPSKKVARYALGLSRTQFERLYGKAERRYVFPAEIDGVRYENVNQARDALGWSIQKIYYHARKGKR